MDINFWLIVYILIPAVLYTGVLVKDFIRGNIFVAAFIALAVVLLWPFVLIGAIYKSAKKKLGIK